MNASFPRLLGLPNKMPLFVRVNQANQRDVACAHASTGMNKYSRGNIKIIDVEALQETVCECYGTVKSRNEALLGPQRRNS